MILQPTLGQSTSTINAPSARRDHTAVWTGTEMIVWGGDNGLNTGGLYNPTTDSWFAGGTSTTNSPLGRFAHTAIWDGNEMIIWGGLYHGDQLDTGGSYDPSNNSWTETSTSSYAHSRYLHTAVWTGTEMLIWGGFDQTTDTGFTNTGGAYNPRTNLWNSIDPEPSERANHSAIWTGSEMIIWGGQGMIDETTIGAFNTGGSLSVDQERFTWHDTATDNAPSARQLHSAIWTGREMIIWGGLEGTDMGEQFPTNTGGDMIH